MLSLIVGCILCGVGLGLLLWDRHVARSNTQQEVKLAAERAQVEELFRELKTRKDDYAALLQKYQHWFSLMLLVSHWIGVEFDDVPELDKVDYSALAEVDGVKEVKARIDKTVHQGPMTVKAPTDKRKKQPPRRWRPRTEKVVDFPLPPQRDLIPPPNPPKSPEGRVLRPV